eukprot:104379_1
MAEFETELKASSDINQTISTYKSKAKKKSTAKRNQWVNGLFVSFMQQHTSIVPEEVVAIKSFYNHILSKKFMRDGILSSWLVVLAELMRTKVESNRKQGKSINSYRSTFRQVHSFLTCVVKHHRIAAEWNKCHDLFPSSMERLPLAGP